MARQPIVIGNWKMNGTFEETLKMITELRHKINQDLVEVVVAPPFTSLYSAYIVLQETTSAMKLAAQNMHWEHEGPFTGEISGAFLKEMGCAYVILGHSERRQLFLETDEMVAKKVQAAIGHDLVPIVCLGETLDQRKSGKTESILEGQLKKSLHQVRINEVAEIVVAYEPVWAIGTGETATPTQIEEAMVFIRHTLGKMYDAPTANAIRLLYGGSITPENAADVFKVKNVDGLLVGGASLIVDKFLKIIQSRVA